MVNGLPARRIGRQDSHSARTDQKGSGRGYRLIRCVPETSSVASKHLACGSAVGSRLGTRVRDLRTVMHLRRLVVSSLVSVALLTGTVLAAPAARASVSTVPRPD